MNDFLEFIAKILEWLPKPLAGAILAFFILCGLVYKMYSLHLENNENDLQQEIENLQIQIDKSQLEYEAEIQFCQINNKNGG